MRKDIEEPMSPVRNKNPHLGKKKISNGVSEGPEQIASGKDFSAELSRVGEC